MNWTALNWTTLLGVALGGALGSVARLGLSQWLGSTHPELNMGTLVVNALGGFILGLWLSLNGNNQFPTIAHLPLALNGVVAFGIVGFCGGLTTFSAFGMDLWVLLQHKAWSMALLYSLGSIAVNLLGLGLGLGLGNVLKGLG
ncbi:MAG: CrcB family protein [Sphingobacteriia bacterium]|nr:CrcB family protein [Sphingobacteriia bacterium]